MTPPRPHRRPHPPPSTSGYSGGGAKRPRRLPSASCVCNTHCSPLQTLYRWPPECSRRMDSPPLVARPPPCPRAIVAGLFNMDKPTPPAWGTAASSGRFESDGSVDWRSVFKFLVPHSSRVTWVQSLRPLLPHAPVPKPNKLFDFHSGSSMPVHGIFQIPHFFISCS